MCFRPRAARRRRWFVVDAFVLVIDRKKAGDKQTFSGCIQLGHLSQGRCVDRENRQARVVLAHYRSGSVQVSKVLDNLFTWLI